jgi:hypothetical protein
MENYDKVQDALSQSSTSDTPFADLNIASPEATETASTEEYPNGDVKYQIHVQPPFTAKDYRSVGWAMAVYGHYGTKAGHVHNKCCLGVYQCPQCDYTERPRIPRGISIRKHAEPMAFKNNCKIHRCGLVHHPCRATMSVLSTETTITLIHKGKHMHLRPHSLGPTIAAKKAFTQMVNIAPEVKPKS